MNEPKRAPLPFLVIAIALLHLVRAGLILLVTFGPVHGVAVRPPMAVIQVITLNSLYFVIPRSEALNPPNPTQDPAEEQSERLMNSLIATPIAVWSAYIGFGLILRMKSGRALAILWSLLTVLLWLRGLLFSWAFHDINQRYFTSAQTKSNIFLALLLNGFIFCYLKYGDGVARAFAQTE